MRRRAHLLAVAACGVAVISTCACNTDLLQSAVVVDTDSTSGNMRSIEPFTTTGPWQIKYNFDCTKQNAEQLTDINQFTVDVLNADDNSTAFEHPQTVVTSVKRTGTVSFQRPGRYYLYIDTRCDWTLQVTDFAGGPTPTATPAPHIAQPTGTVSLDVTFASVFGPYDCTSAPGGGLCSVGDGTVGTSPFGALTLHRTVSYSGGTGDCVMASTQATLTAANGDVLGFQSDSGQSCHKTGVDTFQVSVKGGTGIFKDATGSGTITNRHGTADQWKATVTFAPTPSPSPSPD